MRGTSWGHANALIRKPVIGAGEGPPKQTQGDQEASRCWSHPDSILNEELKMLFCEYRRINRIEYLDQVDY